MHKIRRVFNIFVSVILIFTLIGVISIKNLVHSKNIGTYYLYKTIAWANFVKITEDMDNQKFSYGTIYSKNKLGSNDYKLIEELTLKGNNNVKNILGQTNFYPLKIVLFSTSEEYDKAFKVSVNTVASYDKHALYLSLDELTDYTLIHEYTHFKAESFCKDNKINPLTIPQWFNEGLAEYISFQYRKDKVSKPLERLKNFRELNNQIEFTNAWIEGYDVYYQSYLAIKKIIELKGQNSIQSILLDSNDMEFHKAIERNLGLSVEDFQKLLK
jgi:hypothetical protein